MILQRMEDVRLVESKCARLHVRGAVRAGDRRDHTEAGPRQTAPPRANQEIGLSAPRGKACDTSNVNGVRLRVRIGRRYRVRSQFTPSTRRE